MQPLKDYIKAIEANKAGDREKALALLASSVGADEPTEFMKSALEKMLDSNDAVLTVILGEIENDTRRNMHPDR